MRLIRLLSLAWPLLLIAGCAVHGSGGPWPAAEPADGGGGISPVVFLLTFSFAVGITTYALAFSLLLKKRAPLERLFLVVLTFFLLLMLLSTILIYQDPAAGSPGDALFILLLITRMISAALTIALIAFIQRLVGFGRSRRGRLLYCGAALGLAAAYLLLFIQSYRAGAYFTPTTRTFDLCDILLYLTLPYPIVLFFARYRHIEDQMLRNITRTIVVMMVLFTPFIILDDFNPSISLTTDAPSRVQVRLLFYPILYIVFNAILLYYGFRHFIRRQPPSSGRAARPAEGRAAVNEEVLARFNITRREQELIELVLEGFSNKEIGDRLFISPATVRNHLHHIFEKTGVASRVELVRLCSG